jgi:acyl-CoA thioester hydrolase
MSQAPEVFEIEIAVQPEDIDQMGHVNNVVYLRWVQEAATAHWTAAASAEDQASLVWVVVRHEIDYLRPAMPGDTVIARTWVGQASKIKFDRFVELQRASDRVVPHRHAHGQARGGVRGGAGTVLDRGVSGANSRADARVRLFKLFSNARKRGRRGRRPHCGVGADE